MRALNLGCGSRFRTGWVNYDISPAGPEVRRCNLRAGVCEESGSFDVVYLSHVLEHFDRKSGLALLKECCRVLKAKGVVRVVVPDLEGIAKTYLQAMARALEGDAEWQQRYEWIMLELYDQTVRERSGGEMLRYLRQEPVPAVDFVLARLGEEARSVMQGARRQKYIREERSPLSGRMKSGSRFILRSVRRKLAALALGQENLRALNLGRFRLGGELHLWMYDRYSLGKTLELAGFAEPTVRAADESFIPGWSQHCLDTEPDGSAYKPDSLYMEATRQ
jgi:predicted SAM-dependent methyltransferase